LVLSPVTSPQGMLALDAIVTFQFAAFNVLLPGFALLNTNTLRGGDSDDVLALPVIAGPRLLCYALAQKVGG
jgi:hypothetical protein